MRLGTSQSARPAAIDRNPVNRTAGFSVIGAAPHGTTTRWTYTVPAGKKAIVEVWEGTNERNTAAAPVGTVQNALNYTPNGGSILNLTQSLLTTNGVLDQSSKTNDSLGNVLAGDVIAGSTSDNSTGGTVSYWTAAKIFEYDA